MALDPRLLEILCCPLTRQPLQMLDAQRLASLNAAIAAGDVRQTDGQALSQAWKEALITASGSRAYRIEDGIPVLLADEAVEWSQLG
ncbi:MAG: Trm112 family protein [Xanthomonadales bacterium]|nr:Trm112 family protein [Xanthomonadales bacterium]